jgi:hypothetical protein
MEMQTQAAAGAKASEDFADASVSHADREAIVAAGLDYLQGWYTADASRMERALHPELAKRIFRHNPDGTKTLGQMSAMTLVQRTRAGAGRNGLQRADIKILDMFRDTAGVRADANYWIDYLHVAKVDGQWKIINVLWEMRENV